MTTLKSTWAFGSYHKGMGGDSAHYREKYACWAFKQELAMLGYDVDLSTNKIGNKADAAIRAFQKTEWPDNSKEWDGEIGKKTGNALLRQHIESAELTLRVPGDWLRAQAHWESGDDPGAEYVNPDTSRDRGLYQNNDAHEGNPLSDADAFNPNVTIPRRGNDLLAFARKYAGAVCRIQMPDGSVKTFDAYAMGVATHRTPLGAQQLAVENAVVIPKKVADGGTWEQQAALYIVNVDTSGRQNWQG